MKQIISETDFMKNMSAIYQKNEAAQNTVMAEGLTVDPVVSKKEGGHLVIFRFPFEFAVALSEFSLAISRLVSAVYYRITDIHLTIISHDSAPGMTHPNSTTLKILEAAVTKALDECRVPAFPLIRYSGLFFNKTSVVAKGTPENDSFYLLANAIVYHCRELGLDAKFPWGVHSTINRFAEVTPPEELEKLSDYIKSSVVPLYSSPDHINIGWYTFSKNNFNINVNKKFLIPNKIL